VGSCCGRVGLPRTAKALYERNAKRPTDRDRPAAEGGEAILIKTRMNLPVGEVLPGSSTGDSAFCPGGRIRERHGGTAGLGLVVNVSLPRGPPDAHL
jgi:hypothetical protein